MKIIELLSARIVLKGLMERKMPAKLAYAIARNFRLIDADLEDYEKARIKLLSDNWELDETTNQYKIPKEEESKWKVMYDELLQTKSGYIPYRVDLELADQVDWTPAEMLSIGFIFQEDGSNKTIEGF